MARITIYNSLAAAFTSGNPVSNAPQWPEALSDADSEATSGRTTSVRLIHETEEIRVVGYEFYMEFTDPADVVALRWFQEFYSDNAFPADPPGAAAGGVDRLASNYPAVAGSPVPWMREVLLRDSGLGGVVNHHPLIRQMELVPVPWVAYVTTPQVSLHVPLAVHANHARLAFWIDPAETTIAGEGTIDDCTLIITAHVGGHTEYRYLEDTMPTPYDYSAYDNKPGTSGTRIIRRGT